MVDTAWHGDILDHNYIDKKDKENISKDDQRFLDNDSDDDDDKKYDSHSDGDNDDCTTV